MTELACKVQKAGARLGLDVVVGHVENQRFEQEEHYYNPEHKILLDLGYQPTHNMETELEFALRDLLRYRSGIEARAHALTPDIRWDGTRREVGYLDEVSWMVPVEVGAGR
jgi:UDP-sulfoquinovose synthase